MNEQELNKRKQELQKLLSEVKQNTINLRIKLETLEQQDCGLRGAIEDCNYWLDKMKPKTEEKKAEEVKK